jgi:hypothetical protein
MKLRPIACLTIILALTAFSQAEELPKGAKKEIHAAVKEQNGADAPPALRTPRVDARTEKMRLLIVQGIKDGQLSGGEASTLERELSRIERDEKSAKKDGKADRGERIRLNRDINELHERIWAKTHNGTKPAEPLEK